MVIGLVGGFGGGRLIKSTNSGWGCGVPSTGGHTYFCRWQADRITAITIRMNPRKRVMRGFIAISSKILIDLCEM
jgi:hypothetical protein